MPLNLTFESTYLIGPFIDITLRSIETGLEADTLAIVDTGAQVSLFDDALAQRLGIDLGSAVPTRICRTTTVELRLLGEAQLLVVLPVAFATGVQTEIGNLLGLDVLEYFDFGLSHVNRTIQLGRASSP
jgi:hypothetical protein